MDYASAGVDIDLEGSAVASLIGALGRACARLERRARRWIARRLRRLAGVWRPPLGDGHRRRGQQVADRLEPQRLGRCGHRLHGDERQRPVVVGAEPMAFVDYIAVPKPDPEVHAAIGASLAEACRRARVTLAGGETASLPGIVTKLTSLAPPLATWAVTKPSPVNTCRPATCSSACRLRHPLQRLQPRAPHHGTRRC